MVRWKVRSLLLICTLAVILAQPVTASAASYSACDGNIPQEYVSLFNGLSWKLVFPKGYVFFRSGENEYLLASGDLTYEGLAFEAAACDVYRLVVDGDQKFWYGWEETDFVLDPADSLVYSNLGHFPDLIGAEQYCSVAVMLFLLIVLFMYFFRCCFRRDRR